MRDNINRLLGKLKAAQLDLINAAAAIDVMPSDSMIRKIADLEVAIGAVEHIMNETRD